MKEGKTKLPYIIGNETALEAFTDLVKELLENQRDGKEITMCEYIDMLEARGEARGIKIGEAQGESKGEDRLTQLIKILIKKVCGNRNYIRKPEKTLNPPPFAKHIFSAYLKKQ